MRPCDEYHYAIAQTRSKSNVTCIRSHLHQQNLRCQVQLDCTSVRVCVWVCMFVGETCFLTQPCESVTSFSQVMRASTRVLLRCAQLCTDPWITTLTTGHSQPQPWLPALPREHHDAYTLVAAVLPCYLSRRRIRRLHGCTAHLPSASVSILSPQAIHASVAVRLYLPRASVSSASMASSLPT